MVWQEPLPAQHLENQGAGAGLPAQEEPPTPVSISGEGVEMMDIYKFIWVHLNNKLDRSDNTEAVYRKGQSRLFFSAQVQVFQCVH